MTPMWKSFLSRLRSAATWRSPQPTRQKRHRLLLEPLEDRWVPSFMMRISTNGGSTFGSAIVDNGPGDLDGVIGKMRVSLGAFTLSASSQESISTGLTSLVLGMDGFAASGSHDIVVQASLDGITTAPSPQTLDYNFSGSIGPVASTVTMQTWVDDNNTLFQTSGPGIVADTGPVLTTAGASTGTVGFTGAVPYSMTSQIRARFTVATGSSATVSLNNVNNIRSSSAIGDFVWHDLNANGIQEAGEAGIPGVTVELFKPDNSLVATDVTDAAGLYLFTGLTPGAYYVKVTPPAGYIVSPQDQGSNDAVDSDANPATGVMATTTLVAGEVDLTWDAGLYQLATIGDFIWHDVDANGIQDAGETGVSGATVQLFTAANTLVGTQVTAASGLYLFTGLTPGDYYVQVTPPAGYFMSPQDVGANDAVDSDANTTTGVMATTTLISGEDDRTWDAGLYQTATIGDFIWHDVDANGIQDVGETGVSGATVELFTSGNVLVGTQITAASGLYLFTGLTPGDYYVKVTPPAGYFVSPQDVGANDAIDSDANTTTGVMATTTLISGEDDRTWDAGLYQTATIGDFIWHDVDADGIQDAGETGVAGATVQLFTSRQHAGGDSSHSRQRPVPVHRSDAGRLLREGHAAGGVRGEPAGCGRQRCNRQRREHHHRCDGHHDLDLRRRRPHLGCRTLPATAGDRHREDDERPNELEPNRSRLRQRRRSERPRNPHPGSRVHGHLDLQSHQHRQCAIRVQRGRDRR